MSDSDSSNLSTPPATDDEMPQTVAPSKSAKATPSKSKKNGNILTFFKNKSPSPVRKKRPASPPHEMVPEDNPDIAFIVMFRSRFNEAFPPKSPNVGPQDIESGVADELPSSQIEGLLCAILGLVLNRKKPVEKGHYGRALEEAIQTQKSQWPREWGGVNPLSAGRSFNTMSPTERITLLKTLAVWGLSTCEVVKKMITDSYKARTSKIKDDSNIPLSVQPWGSDGDKRRYWLIEGQDDTPFRIYRESNPKLKTNTWWSVAGSIEEVRTLAQKLKVEDGTRDAKQLGERMLNAIPRFEASEEKIKKRQYRQSLKNRWQKPEPGFSMYEGRTRGKRMKYTFSDEEEGYSDALDVRRSTRNSGRDTSAQPSGPTVTASGRHVKSRATGLYGETLLSGQTTTERASPATGDYERSEGSAEAQDGAGRATRNSANRPVNGWSKGRNNIETYNSVDEMDDEDDATSWDGGDEEEDEPEQMDVDEDEDDLEDEASEQDEPKSLLVRLKYKDGPKPDVTAPKNEHLPASPKLVDRSTAHLVNRPLPSSPLAAAPQQADSAPALVQELPKPALNGLQPAENTAIALPSLTEQVPIAQPPTQQLPPLAKEPALPPNPYTLPPLQSAVPTASQDTAPITKTVTQYPVTVASTNPDQVPHQHPLPPFQPQKLPVPAQHPTPASTWQ